MDARRGTARRRPHRGMEGDRRPSRSTYSLRYRVSAGTDGKAKAELPDGAPPRGSFIARISRNVRATKVDVSVLLLQHRRARHPCSSRREARNVHYGPTKLAHVRAEPLYRLVFSPLARRPAAFAGGDGEPVYQVVEGHRDGGLLHFAHPGVQRRGGRGGRRSPAPCCRPGPPRTRRRGRLGRARREAGARPPSTTAWCC